MTACDHNQFSLPSFVFGGMHPVDAVSRNRARNDTLQKESLGIRSACVQPLLIEPVPVTVREPPLKVVDSSFFLI